MQSAVWSQNLLHYCEREKIDWTHDVLIGLGNTSGASARW